MVELQKKQLLEIKGGASKLGIAAGIIAGVIFVIGVIDGYIRPLRCN